MTTSTDLTAHIDTWEAHRGERHRLQAIDDRHLFCRDCRTTIPLPIVVATASTTIADRPRKRGQAPVTGPDVCPLHAGQWTDTCAPCRSERLTQPPNDPAPNQENP